MNNSQMDISISYEGLRDSANSILKKVEIMKQSLSKATTVMDRTEHSFKSDAADGLREKYHSLYSKFDDFYDAITKYAEFLTTTANKYQEAENKINQNAQDLTSEYDA